MCNHRATIIRTMVVTVRAPSTTSQWRHTAAPTCLARWRVEWGWDLVAIGFTSVVDSMSPPRQSLNDAECPEQGECIEGRSL